MLGMTFMTITTGHRARAFAASSWMALSAMTAGWALASAASAATDPAFGATATTSDTAAPPRAEETPDFGTRINELVVSGSKPAAVAPTTASLATTQPQSIISHSAIDQFVPPTADYSEIVLIAPSISGVATNGPGLSEAKTTLRGFQDGQYNVTYDGIPFGDANGPTHHTTSFFPSSTIGAVVVERGPGEAGQLGTANFGGSINLFSPEVSHTRGGSQTLTGGSWGTAMSVTKLNTGDIAQLHNARVLLNFQELATNGALTNNSAKAQNQLIRAVLPINDHWDLTLFSALNFTRVYTNDNAGATLAQVAQYGKTFGLTTDPTAPTYYKYNIVRKHTDFDYARLAGDVGSKLHVENTLYSYHYFNDTESTLDPTLTAADIAAQTVVLTPGGAKVPGLQAYTKLNAYRISGDTLRTDFEVPFGEIKAGVWLEHAEIGPRARYDYVATTKAPNYIQKAASAVPGALPTTPQNVEYLQYGGWNQVQPFVDVVWKVTPQLTITPGLKYVDFNLSIATDINQKTRTPLHTSQRFTKPLEFLTANYKIADDWSVYGQYATGFLVPDISIFQVPAPNTAPLKPQTSTNYQLGSVFQRGKLSLDGDIYYITFDNLLGTQTDAITKETVYYNQGGATYKGVEGQDSYLLTDQISIFANGSYNDAKSTTGPLPGSTAIPTNGYTLKNAPKGTAAIGLLYRSADWTASISDKYTGAAWADAYESDRYKMPGYNATDIKVTRTFGRVRLEGAVYNLFDSQAVTAIKPNKQTSNHNVYGSVLTNIPYDQYYYQPGRNFEVGLKYSF
jgi:iron complex outermembrane receptor protein